MVKIKDTLEPKSPCCGIIMRHVPDNIHFHYQCPRCGCEYDIDGKTERED